MHSHVMTSNLPRRTLPASVYQPISRGMFAKVVHWTRHFPCVNIWNPRRSTTRRRWKSNRSSPSPPTGALLWAGMFTLSMSQHPLMSLLKTLVRIGDWLLWTNFCRLIIIIITIILLFIWKVILFLLRTTVILLIVNYVIHFHHHQNLTFLIQRILKTRKSINLRSSK